MSGRKRAFTLIEMIIVVVVVGILAVSVTPIVQNMVRASRVNTTKLEMQRLRQAIVGELGGINSGRCYARDVGDLPPVMAPPNKPLQALRTRPAGVPEYDKFRGIGWDGPYIEEGLLEDAWGTAYQYDDSGDGTITSWGPDKSAGGGDDIVINLM